MRTHLSIVTEHVEKLGLGDKSGITHADQLSLVKSLTDANEYVLAEYFRGLKHPSELEDFIVNQIYG